MLGIKRSIKRPSFVLIIILVSLLFLLSAQLSSGQESPSAAAASLANCRYGTTETEVTVDIVPQIGAGVFYKFNNPYWNEHLYPLPSNNAERLLMIKVNQKKSPSGEYLDGYVTNYPLDETLADYIRANPGSLWMVGNEVERGPDPGQTYVKQGDMFPEMYSRAYHDIYYFIKSNDPTARVANAGLIQATPMRLQYMDKMWDSYLARYGEEMPVDVWNVHLYVLPELTPDGEPNNIANAALGTDLALGKRDSGWNRALCSDPVDDVYCFSEHDEMEIIEDQLLAMRNWMRDRGQQNKPLLVSEFSTVYPRDLYDEYNEGFFPQRVSEFMLEAFDHFRDAGNVKIGYPLDDHRLVQQWVWFDTNWIQGSSNLLESDLKTLTLIGRTFRDHVFAEPTYANLIAEETSQEIISQNANGTYDIQLSVNFRNNGNVAVSRSFQVTFYRDSALTQVIGSAKVMPLVRGCATRSYEATVNWTGLPANEYKYWVKLDGGRVISEQPADDADNVIAGAFDTRALLPRHMLDIQLVSDGAGDGGSVLVEPDRPTYSDGDVVRLTAVPFEGWYFSGWSGDLSSTEPVVSVEMDADKAITAAFTQRQYQLDIEVTGQGKVEIDPQKAFYVSGNRVTLLAVAERGWQFVEWQGDLQGDSARQQFTVTDNMVATAKFRRVLQNVVDSEFLPIVRATD